MSECRICKKNHSPFVMNLKPVCLECDELLFDLEIECDEETKTVPKDRPILVLNVASNKAPAPGN